MQVARPVHSLQYVGLYCDQLRSNWTASLGGTGHELAVDRFPSFHLQLLAVAISVKQLCVHGESY